MENDTTPPSDKKELQASEDLEQQGSSAEPKAETPSESPKDQTPESEAPEDTVAEANEEQKETSSFAAKRKKIFGIVAAALVLLLCFAVYTSWESKQPYPLAQTKTIGGLEFRYPSNYAVDKQDDGYADLALVSDDGGAVRGYLTKHDTNLDRISKAKALALVKKRWTNLGEENFKSFRIDGHQAVLCEVTGTFNKTDYTGILIDVFTGDYQCSLVLLSTEEEGRPYKTIESMKDSLRVVCKKRTATFSDGSGNTTKVRGFDHGKGATIATPTSFAREGYAIAGWKITKGNASPSFTSSGESVLEGVKNDVSAKAIWKKACTVTFEDGDGNVLSSKNVVAGTKLTKSDYPYSPAKDGFQFNGWDKTNPKVTEDTTICAQWLKKYTVTFTDGVGNVLKTDTVVEGQNALAPTTTPTRDGYTFNGWDATYSQIASDTTVNATWTKVATLAEKNALLKAYSYLRSSAFSYSGLVRQLEFEGFSNEEATYGADNCGADWNAQAAKKAQQYLRYQSFSRAGLIRQLEFEGFSNEQAVYGVDQAGL